MLSKAVAAIACAVSLASAQHTKVTGQVGAVNSTTPTAREGDHTIHYVTVGKAENNFRPNSIDAKVGDIVSFQFFPTNHSVIKAAWGYPCIPYEDMGLKGDMFYSGFWPTAVINDKNPPTWNLTINNTEPTFFYCGAKGSCTDWGMVGVINANATTPLSTQIGLARKASYMLEVGQPFPNEAEQASLSVLAASATTETLRVTVSPTAQASQTPSGYASNGDGDSDDDSHSGSGLSGGAIAGIAVGSAAVALGAAALFFYMGRTRSLKRTLDRQQAGAQVQGRPDPSFINPAAYSSTASWPAQSRYPSLLPPYHQNLDQGGREMLKPEDAEGLGVDRRSASPPTDYTVQQQQFAAGYHPMDERYRYQSTPHLRGQAPPVVELAVPHEQPETSEFYR